MRAPGVRGAAYPGPAALRRGVSVPRAAARRARNPGGDAACLPLPPGFYQISQIVFRRFVFGGSWKNCVQDGVVR